MKETDVHQMLTAGVGLKARGVVSYNKSGSDGAEKSLIFFSVIISRSPTLKGPQIKLCYKKQNVPI